MLISSHSVAFTALRAALLTGTVLAAHPALAQDAGTGPIPTSPSLAQTGPATTDAVQPNAGGADQTFGVEDIVVTAQKREQSLQEVPISITALSQTAIQANRIQDVRDLNALAPNLTIRLSGGGGQIPNYTLRGLLTTGAAPGTDKGVALYLDGVYVQNVVGSVFDFADIERIEVLKGPQGTLFGRNSTGGAISITTRNPSGEFSARQDLTYGNYDQFRAKTRVDLPQVGPFSASITYLHSERKGDIRNSGAGTVLDYSFTSDGRFSTRTSPRRLGNDNVEAVAASLKADLIDDLDLVYKFDYSQNKFTPGGEGVAYLPPTVNVRTATGASFTLPSIVAQLYNASPNPKTPINAKRPKVVNNAFTTPSYLDNMGHNFTAAYRLTDQISFKNILAFRKSFLRNTYQLDGIGGLINTPVDVRAAVAPASPVPVFLPPSFLSQNPNLRLQGQFVNPATRPGVVTAPYIALANNTFNKENQWSDEFQVNIDTDPVTITAGYLHFYNKIRTSGEDNYFNTLTLIALYGQDGSSIANGRNTPFLIPRNTGLVTSVVTTKSDAFFIQPEIHLTPTLDVVGGFRYTKDRKDGLESAPDQFLADPTLTRPRPIQGVVRYRDSQETYLVGVNWKPTDDLLLYAKYADGYISGGQLATIAFRPEKAFSYEGGVKADLFDGRLRSNFALFHVDYKAVQNTTSGTLTGVPGAFNFGQAVVSSADARARGFEWENTFVPVRGLTLSANVGYTDFKFDQDTVFAGIRPDGSVCQGPTEATTDPLCTGGFVLTSGVGMYFETQRPKWSGNLSAQYDSEELFNGGHLTARVDANFRSKILMTSDTTRGNGFALPGDPAIRQAATIPFTWLVNGRVGLVDMDLGFTKGSVSAWGKNLFNNRQITQYVGLDLAVLGYIGSVIYERARTYGIDVSFSF